MQINDRHHIRLRVYERGAVRRWPAVPVPARRLLQVRRGLLDSPVRVTTHGGELSIAWQGEGSSVMLSGPAVTVFEGEINL
jgi:diaminopimelate epimerase